VDGVLNNESIIKIMEREEKERMKRMEEEVEALRKEIKVLRRKDDQLKKGLDPSFLSKSASQCFYYLFYLFIYFYFVYFYLCYFIFYFGKSFSNLSKIDICEDEGGVPGCDEAVDIELCATVDSNKRQCGW
jgi:hypothetical protein